MPTWSSLYNYNQIDQELNDSDSGDFTSVYKFRLSVCLFVSNKRQNGWTDRAQILCGISQAPGKVYKWSKLKKIVFKVFYFCKKNLNFENPRIFFYKIREQNSISNKFSKSTKFFYEIRELFFCFFFFNVHKENMFTI